MIRHFQFLAAALSIFLTSTSFGLDRNSKAPDLTAACQIYLTRDFKPGTSILKTEVPNAAALKDKVQARIEEAKSELAKSKDRRKKQDTRFFLIRWFTGNMVTRELKQSLSVDGQTLELLNEFEKLLKSISAARPRNDNSLKTQVYEFIVHRSYEVLEQITKFINDTDPARERSSADAEEFDPLGTTEDQLDLGAEIERLSGDLDTFRSNYKKLLGDADDAVFEAHKQTIIERIKPKLKSVPADSIIAGMLNLALRFEKSPSEVADLFVEIDKAGKARKGKIDDEFDLTVLHVVLRNGLTPWKAVETFLKLDTLGRTRKKGFTLYDQEVSALLDASTQLTIDPETYMKRFFLLESAAREKLKALSDSFYLNDQALTVLTRMSFEFDRGLTEEQLISNFLSDFVVVYNAGKSAEKGFEFDDLGIAILMDLCYRHQISTTEITQRFFDLRAKLKKADLNLEDESVSRILAYQIGQGLSAEAMAAFLAKANRYDGVSGALSLQRALTVLTYALADALQGGKKPEKLSDLNFEAASRLGLLVLDGAEDRLSDVAVRQRAERRRRSSGSYSSSRSSSSYRSSSGGSELGSFSYGTDGASIGLGKTLSVGLSDGSLRMNLGGGISYNLSTGKVGFKLF